MIELDLNLISCYHLFEAKVSYSQLIGPYILLLKQNLSSKIESCPDAQFNLIDLIKTIHRLMDLDQFILDRDISSPSDPWSLSQSLEDIWSWKQLIIKKGLNNVLLRYLNQQLLDLLKTSLVIDKSLSDYEQ